MRTKIITEETSKAVNPNLLNSFVCQTNLCTYIVNSGYLLNKAGADLNRHKLDHPFVSIECPTDYRATFILIILSFVLRTFRGT